MIRIKNNAEIIQEDIATMKASPAKNIKLTRTVPQNRIFTVQILPCGRRCAQELPALDLIGNKNR